MSQKLSISSGFYIGAAIGSVVTVIISLDGLSLSEIFVRGGVLIFGGGWCGMMVAWLNNLLPEDNSDDKPL